MQNEHNQNNNDNEGHGIEITLVNQKKIYGISDDAYKKLINFLGIANKSADYRLESFQDHWFAFILAVINDDGDPDYGDFENLLVEDKGWSQKMASKLSDKMEQNIALLDYFKEKQNQLI